MFDSNCVSSKYELFKVINLSLSILASTFRHIMSKHTRQSSSLRIIDYPFNDCAVLILDHVSLDQTYHQSYNNHCRLQRVVNPGCLYKASVFISEFKKLILLLVPSSSLFSLFSIKDISGSLIILLFFLFSI